VRYYLSGESYAGAFVANLRHGKGQYAFSNGDVYVGDWVDDRRTGRGIHVYSNGSVFIGEARAMAWLAGSHLKPPFGHWLSALPLPLKLCETLLSLCSQAQQAPDFR
jgi:hypothetical protein